MHRRELRLGHINEALAAIESLNTDFPDLDQDNRLDLALRSATVFVVE